MTAFEYIYLMNEFEVKLLGAIMAQFSLVSAFLVAVYAVSHRLSMRMLGIVIGIYTVMGMFMALNIWSTQQDMALLAVAALEAKASGLIELPRVAILYSGSEDIYRTLSWLIIALEIIIYAASLIFTFGVRRAALAKSDTA